MKRILQIVTLSLISTLSLAETLETTSYRIEFGSCPEGEVTCSDIPITVVHKPQGKSTSLRGSTKHSLCDDGITPCRFQGYQFAGEDSRFFVYTDGTLEVSDESGQVFVEKGQWSD